MALPLSSANSVEDGDRPVHGWYRFVLSFPPHLVRHYLERFGVSSGDTVLDPFCGTGTTLVECKKQGIPSLGIEANPMAWLASRVKTDWSVDPEVLVRHADSVAGAAMSRLRGAGIADFQAFPVDVPELTGLPPERERLLLQNSISPLPLHKALVLLDCLTEHRVPALSDHERVALAQVLVTVSSNLKFGPEVGVGPAKADAPVVGPWRRAVHTMAADLGSVGDRRQVSATVVNGDARQAADLVGETPVAAVFTSPPYPNEKDYSRTTRLESVLLGLVGSMADLREVKKGFVRSNTRSVYVEDDDDQWVRDHPLVQRVADEIEAKRLAMGKTSGFERNYHRVTRLYFGGMARHLASLRRVLRPGAWLGYVVGDQASYLQVMIRTGEILASIAESMGYGVVGIDLFRTRLATATREQLREEVVVLRWPGHRAKGGAA